MAGHLLGAWRRGLLARSRRWPRWLRYAAICLLVRRFPVGAAALIRDGAGRVLLVRQTYHRPASWSPPGGWVGRGETPHQAAVRETYEEVGLRVAVGRPLAIGTGGYDQVNILFECRVLDERDAGLSQEIDRAAYFAPNELPPMPAGTRRWLEEGLAAQERSTPRLTTASRLTESW